MVCGGFEIEIAKTSIAALGNHHLLPDLCQIKQNGFTIFIHNLRANGHFERDIIAIFARALPSHAVLAILGKEMLLVAKIDQCVETGHGLDDHIASPPAIAAIGAAKFDVFLPAE